MDVSKGVEFLHLKRLVHVELSLDSVLVQVKHCILHDIVLTLLKQGVFFSFRKAGKVVNTGGGDHSKSGNNKFAW